MEKDERGVPVLVERLGKALLDESSSNVYTNPELEESCQGVYKELDSAGVFVLVTRLSSAIKETNEACPDFEQDGLRR